MTMQAQLDDMESLEKYKDKSCPTFILYAVSFSCEMSLCPVAHAPRIEWTDGAIDQGRQLDCLGEIDS